jgi:hypothetical protein
MSEERVAKIGKGTKRKHELVPAVRLFELMEKAGLTEDVEMAEALGVSASGIRDMRASGLCRKVYILGAECLVRRLAPSARPVDGSWRVVIKGNTSSEKLAITAVAKTMNLTVIEI